MEPNTFAFFLIVAFLYLPSTLLHARELNTYIVQLHPRDTEIGFDHHSKEQWHLSFIPSGRLLYSYHTAFEGFAAQLTDAEAAALRAIPGVSSVRPDQYLHLHTTYSYEFLGLGSNGDWGSSGLGRGVIIGVLDTGVWPESPSFSDRGMPPVPRRWRGGCQAGESFNSSNCNRKLIGARFYSKGHRANATPDVAAVEYVSPRDAHGHGTHTSSTAAGAEVGGASVFGAGAGVARGWPPWPTSRCTRFAGSAGATAQTFSPGWTTPSATASMSCPSPSAASLSRCSRTASPLGASAPWNAESRLSAPPATTAPSQVRSPTTPRGLPPSEPARWTAASLLLSGLTTAVLSTGSQSIVF
ncbi:hypothetical protein HPP92_025741 [Vanilla planifolia]|uniref:Uncharacterized protein n=1 Tax=Vanilla planifolia TaxID=51239 RepID=A0A835PQP1_VANPL|nr:hypothetical protein HPP92_025741 [Vanilla planifolia]